MTWQSPFPGWRLVATSDPDSYKTMPWWPQPTTGVPMLPDWEYIAPDDYVHPGAFGVHRKHDVHTGVDLYASEFTDVVAVETGVVVKTGWFTGPQSVPPTPWWRPTAYAMIEGESGVVCYGEIDPHLTVGRTVLAGNTVGIVERVLKKDKGRPTSMLHLELYEHGYRGEPVDWALGEEKPLALRDPTPYLLELCK